MTFRIGAWDHATSNGTQEVFEVRVSVDYVRRKRLVLWGTCEGCPGWSVAADDWEAFLRLTSEHHAEADHGWWALKP